MRYSFQHRSHDDGLQDTTESLVPQRLTSLMPRGKAWESPSPEDVEFRHEQASQSDAIATHTPQRTRGVIGHFEADIRH